MTIDESLAFIQPFIKRFEKNIDIICVFHINGKVKNIIYDSDTKTLSEPFPDKTDDNNVLLLPYYHSKPITIKWECE